MKVIHTIAEFRVWRRTVAAAAQTFFVPTMGALHEGHASLVRAARQMGGPPAGGNFVVASIFVNPTQFGPQEDFAKYPRTLDADCGLLAAAGCDAVFAPSAEEMYGPPPKSLKADSEREASVMVSPGGLGGVLEGAIRPGHFRGVCTVVAKLLGIVQPSHLLLGQKDYQQQAILRQMTADLNMPVEVITCPTMREPDGLAMSSRNRYLNAEERSRAVGLYEALTWAKAAHDGGEKSALVLEAGMHERLVARGLAPQYAVVANATTLQLIRDAGGRVAGSAVALIAAKLGPTRLIDNMVL
jgi:pantoate--beta-alanine ligase